MRALAQLLLGATPVRDGIVDVSDALVMVPAARAKRSLEWHLLALAKEDGHALVPPQVVTPAGLASRFVVPAARVVGAIGARLAWRQVIAGADERTWAALAPSLEPVQALEPAALDALAARIALLHDDAVSACTDFATIAVDLRARAPDLDMARWDAFCVLERAWRTCLDAAGAVDANSATLAACHGNVAGCDERAGDETGGAGRLADGLYAGGVRRIFVLLADPEPIQRLLLRTLAARGVRVAVAVHATGALLPAPLDDEGFPCHEEWARAAVPVAQEQIMLADTPADQAAAVIDAIAQLPAPRRSADILVAVPDASVAAQAATLLPACGLRVRALPTRTAAQAPLGMLLQAVAAHVHERSCRTLGALVRNPDVEAWLVAQGHPRPVATVAHYAATSGADELPAIVRGQGDGVSGTGAIVRALDELLEPLVHASDATGAIDALRALLQLLNRDATQAGHETAEFFHSAADELLAVPAALLRAVDPARVITLVREQMESRVLASEGLDDGIELVGWLDAGISDAPDLVLTGMNDGIVPEGMVVDPWLPDSVRARLGMPCARRRQARDAWILHSLLTRKRSVRLVMGRTRTEGDPLQPSRLLLGLEGAELARRVKWLGDPETPRASAARWRPRHAKEGKFAVSLAPVGPTRIESISVTAFRDYLQDPALFRLKRDPRLRLEEAAGEALELDAMGFGTLVHAALQAWGREEAQRTSAGQPPTVDAAAIEERVHRALDEMLRLDFPESVHGAYRVQFALARERLSAFARVQAEWAAAGWRVLHAELDFAMRPSHEGARQAPSIGKSGILVTGRIDRVDVHPEGSTVALDYKTSAEAVKPGKAHRSSKGRWLDLQLPLYAVLLRSIGVKVRPAGLGYFALPSNPSGTAVLLADEWGAEFQAEAEREAERIADSVAAGEFPHEVGFAPGADDPFAPLYGVGMRGMDREDRT